MAACLITRRIMSVIMITADTLLLPIILAYVDDTDVLRTDWRMVTKHYLMTWFTIDLISCVPYEVMTL